MRYSQIATKLGNPTKCRDVPTEVALYLNISQPWTAIGQQLVTSQKFPLERDDFSSNRHPALSFCLGMISGQTLRVCPEGKPVPTFPDHALRISHGLPLGQYNRIVRRVENARRPLYFIAIRQCFPLRFSERFTGGRHKSCWYSFQG